MIPIGVWENNWINMHCEVFDPSVREKLSFWTLERRKNGQRSEWKERMEPKMEKEN